MTGANFLSDFVKWFFAGAVGPAGEHRGPSGCVAEHSVAPLVLEPGRTVRGKTGTMRFQVEEAASIRAPFSHGAVQAALSILVVAAALVVPLSSIAWALPNG